MTRTLILYQGADMSPSWDYSDWVEWPDCKFGIRAYNGEASQGQLRIRDVLGETGNSINLPGGLTYRGISAHNVMTLTEDASGVAKHIWRGWVIPKDYSRGAQRAYRYREIDVSVEDYNTELRGIIVGRDAVWSRPAETDVARVEALRAAYLNGSPRAATVIGNAYIASGNTVTLPAKDYEDATVDEVLRDCATPADKRYWVILEDDGSLELFYDLHDSAAYASTLAIRQTGNPSEVDGWTTFMPIWDAGPASREDGQQLLSGVKFKYGPDASVYVNHPATVDEYNHFEEVVHDNVTKTAAEATAKATAILNTRRFEQRTYSLSIDVPASRIHLLRPGMNITIQAKAIPDADDDVMTRRIAQMELRLLNNETYHVTLKLDRPARYFGAGTPAIFNPPAEAGGLLGVACTNSGSNFGSDYAPWAGDMEERVEITAASAVAAGNSMVAVTSWAKLSHTTVQVYDERGNTWTLDAEYENAGSSLDDTVQIWRCNVTTAIQAGDYIRFANNLGTSLLSSQEAGGRCIGVYSYSGSLTVAGVGAGAGAFSAAPAINTPAGGVVVAGISIGADAGGGAVTGDSDWDSMIPGTDTEPGAGFLGKAIYAQQLTGASASTWTPTLSSVLDWAAISVGYSVSGGGGASSQPVGGSGEATPGTSDGAAREDHVHAHDDLSDHPDETHHHASSTKLTPTGTVESTNVQDAIAELAGPSTDLTMGTTATVTTTGTPAFLNVPGIAKLDADHLLLVYRQGTDHATTTDGKIVYKIGTIGSDYSVTWGSQADVYDDASLDCRDSEVTVLSDGTPIVSFFTWNGATTYDIKTVTGSWNGSTVTWGTPVSVGTSFTAEACTAKVVELWNGDLLLPVYGNNGGNHTAATVKSTDGGATWGSQTTIVTGTVGTGDNWTEPYMILLADGRLHCLVREDTDDRIYRTLSSDGGATWSTPTDEFPANARPAHIQVQSGGLLYVSRADGQGDTVYRESSDYGETWTDETVVDATGTMNEYASIVQINPYRYGVAYSYRTTSTDADIAFVQFTDAANLDLIAGIGGTTTSSGGASDLDDLTDVVITTPAADEQLQYVGGTWVNNARRWEPVVTDPGTGPELVFDGSGDIVMTWVDYG